MKHSIKNIFKNLSVFFVLATIFAGFGVLVAIDHTSSYTKVENLTNQKTIILEILNLSKESIEISLIKLQGKTTQLRYDVEKLHSLYEYSILEKLLLSNSKEYLSDLDTLDKLRVDFTKKADAYYNSSLDSEIHINELQESFNSLNSHITAIIIRSIYYDQAKFNVHKKVTYFAFLVILFATLWYRKRLALIYKDLEFLNNVNLQRYETFSQEAESISLKIKRKPVIAENPAMLDAVTGINNLKGMMNSYSERKGIKDSNFTSVTVFEVDNFSKTNKAYSQELTQSILKKIAFSISLHEQLTDVIARTDYNQFTVILSRATKDILFKDAENIRQSISELKLNSAEMGDIELSISGGHVIKPNNLSLEEAIRQAKKVLLHAQKTSKNRISQVKDLAHSEL